MRLFILVLHLFPIFLIGQANSWQIELNLGANLSINRMKTQQGKPELMSNSIRPGGLWSILGKYQLSNRTSLHFGIDHAAYKYQYRYRIERQGGASARSTVFVWGFPIGVENQWTNKHIAFATGYGLKYRINSLGSPFNLEAYSSVYNLENELVFTQFLQEYNSFQRSHFLALYAYTKLIFQVRSRFKLAIQLSYNQGMQIHESFTFRAINNYPLANIQRTDEYTYTTRASYLAASLSFTYIFKKKEELIEPAKNNIVNSD